MMQQQKLSVLIPCYNEADRIAWSLQSVITYLRKNWINAEIIVINDGSQDQTEHVVQSVIAQHTFPISIISYSTNQGRGFALKKGFEQSTGNYILYTDADLATPFEELENLYYYCKQGFDLVIGSRALQSSIIMTQQPWYRQKMGRVFNQLTQKIAVAGIKDTQCGFKLITRTAAEHIFPLAITNSYAFDVEILYLAHKFHYPIKEVGITWHHRENSKVNPVIDSLKMAKDLLHFRIKNLLAIQN